MPKPVWPLAALVVAGCGHVTIYPLPAATHAAARTTPADLASADVQSRVAGHVDGGAALCLAVLGPFTADGKLAPGGAAALRYTVPGGADPVLRTVYLDGQDRPHTFDGAVSFRTETDATLTFADGALDSWRDAVGVDLTHALSPGRAIALARKSGLDAPAYVLSYAASAAGQALTVTEWKASGAGNARVFDALSGQLPPDPAEDDLSLPTGNAPDDL